MAADKWFFVINPVSGRGKGLTVWGRIKSQLDCEGVIYEQAISEYPKHVLKIVAERYHAGFRHFIGIGGDGTLNEMINAVFSAAAGQPDHHCVFGLIPVGTGNDWIRSRSSLLTIKNLAFKLKERQYTKHDVGVINADALSQPHYFINVAGAGIDGAIAQQIHPKRRGHNKGKLAYLMGLMVGLFTYQAPVVKVTIAGETFFSGQPFLISAAKGRYFGGGMQISPQALPDSGGLDITVVKKVGKRKIFPQLYKLFNGQIDKVSFIQKASADTLHVTASAPMAIQADGELVAVTTHFSMAIVIGQIRVLS
jgi:YegS/Rv2252/BmrU family lipid kinase